MRRSGRKLIQAGSPESQRKEAHLLLTTVLQLPLMMLLLMMLLLYSRNTQASEKPVRKDNHT